MIQDLFTGEPITGTIGDGPTRTYQFAKPASIPLGLLPGAGQPALPKNPNRAKQKAQRLARRKTRK